MTDILSPSPYSYLDALTPAERQAEIGRRQHQRREEWCDDARRARDYQAELAELMEEFQEFQQEYVELEQLADARCAEKAFVEEERDAALSRIAELEAALDKWQSLDNEQRQGLAVVIGFPYNYDGPLPDWRDCIRFDERKIRKLLGQ